MVRGGHGKGRGGGGGGDGMRLGQLGAVVTVRMMEGVVGVRVRDTGLPCGLPHGGLCVSPGDEVSVLELGTAGLLRRQLELDKHHVVTNTKCQGEGGAAGQEVADLQRNGRSAALLKPTLMVKHKLTLCAVKQPEYTQQSSEFPHSLRQIQHISPSCNQSLFCNTGLFTSAGEQWMRTPIGKHA